jgi:hypothetical protein
MYKLLLGSLCLAACASHDVVVGDLQEVNAIRAIPNPDLDILFVIDNSPSMLEEQQSLEANFPLMIDALSSLDGGLPNLHIGVVTSDLGTNGSRTGPGRNVGGCNNSMDGNLLPIDPTHRFLSDVSDGHGARIKNYDGELRDAFAQLAAVGDAGCGFEQHLGAMYRALDNNPTNAGFLRPDANLAIVVLGDEDDCSIADTAFFDDDPALGTLQSFRCFRFGVECDQDTNTVGTKTHCHPAAPSQYLDDVQPFADFLVSLKGDARKVMVAGIVGDPSPVAVELRAPQGSTTPEPALAHSCTYGGTQTADPAVRIAAFLDAFPGRSRLTSICNPDLSGAVGDVALSAKQLMGDPCLTPDVLPATCELVDVRDSAPDDPIRLPRCADGGTTCFDIVPDAAACPNTPDHLRVQIQRGVDPSADTWTHIRCQPR